MFFTQFPKMYCVDNLWHVILYLQVLLPFGLIRLTIIPICALIIKQNKRGNGGTTACHTRKWANYMHVLADLPVSTNSPYTNQRETCQWWKYYWWYNKKASSLTWALFQDWLWVPLSTFPRLVLNHGYTLQST